MAALKDSDEMPFGKHKGEKLGDVPASYLLWFAEQDWAGKFPELLAYINQGRKHLEKESKEKHY